MNRRVVAGDLAPLGPDFRASVIEALRSGLAKRVLTNEPGVYRPGIDGYRTINTMIVGAAGVEIPSRFQSLHPIDARVIAV